MLAFILLNVMFTINLAYEGINADSKVLSFLGIFCSGMCAMCGVVVVGYMMGAV